MKKNLPAIFAVALALAASAFTWAPSQLTTYNWQRPDGTDQLLDKTRDQAIAHYGCDKGTQLCAEAYLDDFVTRVISADLHKN
ncbi:MAG TPA: hypothetical protein VG870_01750 [Chitinophagaceae bacterium]|nr:hypothetical protein [Chitinophagaceae bacterium]